MKSQKSQKFSTDVGLLRDLRFVVINEEKRVAKFSFFFKMCGRTLWMAPYFLNNFNLFNNLRKSWWYFIIGNTISACVYFLIRHVFQKKKNSINIDILISHGVSINFNFDFRVSNQFRICFLLPAQAFSLTNSPLINFNLSTSLSLLINFIIIYQPDLSFFRALNLLICYILSHSIYYGYCVLWITVTVYSVRALEWEVGR